MLMQRSRRASGFTMIEMAVTMTIFAILVALGVPSMTTWIRNNKVRTVTDSLQTGLRLAQAESLRRSRQVVFALTNSTTPNAILPLPAVGGGLSWAIWTIPSMTDGSEQPQFIQSGVLSNASTGVIVTGVAAVCFNSMGRLVNNATNVTAITGAGNNCVQPTVPPPQQPTAPPAEVFGVSTPGADRPLQINLSLGGQVHMCDPGVALSAQFPQGC
jgi:type IV fimbrial biogenesis protein FimT